jgi:hypothetical protein
MTVLILQQGLMVVKPHKHSLLLMNHCHQFLHQLLMQKLVTMPVPCHVGDLIKEFLACFKGPMSYRLKTQLLNYLFKLIVMEIGGIDLFKFVIPDFINTSLNATKTLFDE